MVSSGVNLIQQKNSDAFAETLNAFVCTMMMEIEGFFFNSVTSLDTHNNKWSINIQLRRHLIMKNLQDGEIVLTSVTSYHVSKSRGRQDKITSYLPIYKFLFHI